MWVWGTLPNGLQTIPRDMTYDPRTNKINCKLVNDKVMVRVGGGYSSIYEYIETYGFVELSK